MTFEMPLPPNFSNSRMHWRAKHRAKLAYWKQVDERQNCGLIPAPPKAPFQKVAATATLYLWSHMDEDGAMARLKWPQDWLVTRGYLADDRRGNIKWAGLPEQHIDRTNQRLVLTLEAT